MALRLEDHKRWTILLVAAITCATLGFAGLRGAFSASAATRSVPPVTHSATPTTGPRAASVKTTLLIYGDSLTVLSEVATRELYDARYNIVFRARGGTSICDWTAGANKDRSAVRPQRVVIAFTGNAASCSASDLSRGGFDAWLANYRRSLLTMRSVFNGIPISVVGSPAMGPQPVGTWYPHNGDPALDQMYRQVCAENGMTYNSAADDLLTPGHVFSAQRPAFPGNGPLTTVRATDGVHVLPAGALYYGYALGQ